MESNVKYETSKIDWFEQHSLTPEQLATLIAEKMERAREHLVHRQVVRHFD